MDTFSVKNIFDTFKNKGFTAVENFFNKFSGFIDINQKDEDRNTLLMNAIGYEDFILADFLVKKFKDTIDINQNGYGGKSILIQQILDMWADIEHESSFPVKFLVNNFKDTIDINQKDSDGKTALMYACVSDYSLVKFLVENFKDSIDINQKDNDGNTTLMLASNFEKIRKSESKHNIANFLIENFKDTILYS